MFEQLGKVKGHKPQAAGHIVELCPQTNLMVGVYLAAALFFLNNYKAFFFFFFKQTVLALQYTDRFTRSPAGSLHGPQKAVAPIYR